MDLSTAGWTPENENHFAPLRAKGLVPGLIAVSYGSLGTVWTENGPQDFTAAGRLRLQDKQERSGLPAVGDWVALRPPEAGKAWLVQEILPRRTAFWRKMAGTSHKVQVVAANMDVIFVTTSLNRDFNARRLERYLSLVRESGAKPVILLTKADLLEDDELESYLQEAQDLDVSIPVHPCSIVTGTGLDAVHQHLQPGTVTAFLGSSGVGKSSLINHFLGHERQRVNELRNDERGRHTTTHRELLVLPGGSLVIDTPGMREVTLMDHAEGLDEAFDDIMALAAECRFTDCNHGNEPGCAVQAAIESGELDEDRLDHYRVLKAEVALAEAKRLEQQRKLQSRGAGRKSRRR